MPSDPSGVIPSGTLIRSAPDWYDDNLAVASYTANIATGGPGEGYATIALFNNATQGQAFKVYGITSHFDGGEGAYFYYAKGTVGAQVVGANALRPDLPAPFGQVFFQSAFGALTVNPFYTGPFVGGFGTSGYDSMSYFSPFPMAIIPAGYSMVLVDPFSSALIVGATWWYQVANE